MSYRISYDGKAEKTFFNEKDPKKYFRYTLMCIVGMIVAILLYTNKPKLEKIIYPGDPQVTKNAAAAMISDIRSGENVKDAVMAFCQEIVDNAEVPDN